MIIYYKLPSYPTAKATLPFAKISAMRKKHLMTYYHNCAAVKKISNVVRPDKLETFSKVKSVEEMDGNKAETLQRDGVIKKLTNEVTGHYSELGRRVHSSHRKKRQWFLSESTQSGFAVDVYNSKKFSEGDSEQVKKSSMSAKMVRICRCPIYMS